MVHGENFCKQNGQTQLAFEHGRDDQGLNYKVIGAKVFDAAAHNVGAVLDRKTILGRVGQRLDVVAGACLRETQCSLLIESKPQTKTILPNPCASSWANVTT